MGGQVAADQELTARRPAMPVRHGRRGAVSSFFFAKRRTRLVLLLTAPMLWLVLAYLGSIAVLLLSALWSTDFFTGNPIHTYTIDNLRAVYTESLYRTVTVRTIS